MIVDRIKQIIEYKKISTRKFCMEVGVANGFFDKVKDVGSEKVLKILNRYPEINSEWLLTGKGEMLKPDQPNRNVDDEHIQSNVENNAFQSSEINTGKLDVSELIFLIKTRDRQISIGQEHVSKGQEHVTKSQEQIDRLITVIEKMNEVKQVPQKPPDHLLLHYTQTNFDSKRESTEQLIIHD